MCMRVNTILHPFFHKYAVISPELIRQVELRMNRNYLPPALKMQQSSDGSAAAAAAASGLSQSPPTTTFAAPHHSSPNCSNILTTQLPLATSSVPLLNQNAAANSRRVYGRACKLPTVQEVGKFIILVKCFYFYFYFCFNLNFIISVFFCRFLLSLVYCN